MKKKHVVGDMGSSSLEALYSRAERQLDEATNLLVSDLRGKRKATEPWVKELVTTAAQLASVQPSVQSPALSELEKEIMLLLAYHVEGDARVLVQKRMQSL